MHLKRRIRALQDGKRVHTHICAHRCRHASRHTHSNAIMHPPPQSTEGPLAGPLHKQLCSGSSCATSHAEPHPQRGAARSACWPKILSQWAGCPMHSSSGRCKTFLLVCSFSCLRSKAQFLDKCHELHSWLNADLSPSNVWIALQKGSLRASRNARSVKNELVVRSANSLACVPLLQTKELAPQCISADKIVWKGCQCEREAGFYYLNALSHNSWSLTRLRMSASMASRSLEMKMVVAKCSSRFHFLACKMDVLNAFLPARVSTSSRLAWYLWCKQFSCRQSAHLVGVLAFK